MKSILKYLITSSAIAVCSLQAGITLTFETEDGEEVNYFESGKTATYTNGNLTTVIDLKTDCMYEINHYNQAFTKVIIADFPEKMANLMRDQMGDTSSNPMFQKMIEHQKKMAAQTKMDIQKSGTEKIAGFKADVYVITKNGEKVMEKWISPDLQKKISKEFDYPKLNKMMTDMSKAMAEFMPTDPETEAEHKVDQKGLTLYQTESSEFDFGDGPSVIRTLVSVDEEKVDATIFEIPGDYEEVDYADFMDLEEEDSEDIW